MNTSLNFIALALAAALPSSAALSLSGAAIPVAGNPLHVLGAFVVALVLLTLLGDYHRQPTLAVNAINLRQHTARRSRAEHPLAA